MDRMDKHILSVLQKNGRISNNELATIVGLSPSPCLRRVKLLEKQGIIQKYVAILDAEKIGKKLTLFTRIWLVQQDIDTVNQFVDVVKDLPEVVECHLMGGDCDFLLKVVCNDLNAYRKFQNEYLTRKIGIQNIKTEIPMQNIKSTTEIPV
ncbi:TPA: Lrp/AsnC family transcriptional regulator [Acinetobacter baumannii]